MSQHDNVIDNQAGAAFRADLNAALQAAASNQSGSSAPTTTYPYQFWADTGTGLLKQRNGANNAWNVIGLLDNDNYGMAPVGMGAVFYMSTPPAGWLKANGGAVSRTTYAALFARIGTTYGAGDGSTTFNLPEDRGEFWRGWDDGRGVDAGRVFGSMQAQDVVPHSHFTTPTVGAPGSGGSSGYSYITNGAPTTSGATSSNGVESRPRNRAVLKCIKYI